MSDSVSEAVVPVRTPFRLDLSASVLRRLSSNVVDVFDGTTYRRLLGDPAQPTLFSVRQTSPSTVTVRLEGPHAEGFDATELVQRTLGTDVDLSAFYAGAATIDWLDALAAGARGVKPPRYPSLWEAVVNAVVYQQISIHAAGAILRRAIERYSSPHDRDGVRLYAFPTARALLEADPLALRGHGLSINKINALKAIAAAVEVGTLAEAPLNELPTDALLTELTTHKGIGPWTAAVVALRGFGRLDVFPMKDSGVTAALRKFTGQPIVDPAAIIDRLRPQQGMLYYHLLIARLVDREEISLS